ncbi:MAG TPA: sigma-70 family RNA polymerase sigma factor [Candidatus Onthoplasma faecipullorum]|nr:sigma-70 family RNA polymerase sigma factor [Candidatus Onthoplasma faecipullorum]
MFKKFINKIKTFFKKLFKRDFLSPESIVNYIFSAESLPEPLPADKESSLVRAFQDDHDLSAKSELIEHNLRLVMYIAKRFESNKLDMQDLVSVGSIGLIKAVDSYKLDKNIKLATYASRCIENEILMYLRKVNKSINDLSLDDSLSSDDDGNNLTLAEIIPDERIAYDQIELKDQKNYLMECISELNEREKRIMCMRYGLCGYDELTQKEVADSMNISQSYISRLEKKILHKLKKQMQNNM